MPKGKVTKLKEEAWEWFSKYIRLRDCLITTGDKEYGKCFTCDKTYPFAKLQAGHFVGGRSKPVLFNEEIVHAQCVGCNLFKKGNYEAYTEKMLDLHGEKKVKEFLELRHNKDKTWTIKELEEIKEEYKGLYKDALENN
jgi:hypothetical protein